MAAINNYIKSGLLLPHYDHPAVYLQVRHSAVNTARGCACVPGRRAVQCADDRLNTDMAHAPAMCCHTAGTTHRLRRRAGRQAARSSISTHHTINDGCPQPPPPPPLSARTHLAPSPPCPPALPLPRACLPCRPAVRRPQCRAHRLPGVPVRAGRRPAPQQQRQPGQAGGPRHWGHAGGGGVRAERQAAAAAAGGLQHPASRQGVCACAPACPWFGRACFPAPWRTATSHTPPTLCAWHGPQPQTPNPKP